MYGSLKRGTACDSRPAGVDSVAAGKPLEYFYRHLYLPELGMFRTLPEDLQLGKFQDPPAAPVACAYTDGGFVKDGVEYR